MLAQYPSTDHESLVIQFLKVAKKTNVILAASETLEKIGERSEEAMQDLVTRLKIEHPQWISLHEIESRAAGLKTRLAPNRGVADAGAGFGSKMRSTPHSDSIGPAITEVEHRSFGLPILRWIAIVAVLGALVSLSLLVILNNRRARGKRQR